MSYKAKPLYDIERCTNTSAPRTAPIATWQTSTASPLSSDYISSVITFMILYFPFSKIHYIFFILGPVKKCTAVKLSNEEYLVIQAVPAIDILYIDAALSAGTREMRPPSWSGDGEPGSSVKSEGRLEQRMYFCLGTTVWHRQTPFRLVIIGCVCVS